MLPIIMKQKDPLSTHTGVIKVWRNETVIQLAFLNAGQDARILVSGGIPYIAFYESNNKNIIL